MTGGNVPVMKQVIDWLRQPLQPATDEHRTAFSRFTIGLAACAAVGSYILTPMIRFADHRLLFAAAMMAIFGLVMGQGLYPPHAQRVWLWMGQINLVIAAGIFAWAGMDAASVATWHDERCARIQSAMFRPAANTRGDLPELFAALQCRPQGAGPEKPILSDSPGGPPNRAKVEAFERVRADALRNEIDLIDPAKKDQPRK